MVQGGKGDRGLKGRGRRAEGPPSRGGGLNSVSIIGLGVVGLSTAVALASRGIRTVGVDADRGRIEAIKQGRPPFYEPQLERLLKGALGSGSLSVVSDQESAVKGTDITFMAVGTPSKADGRIDLSQVKSASCTMGRALRGEQGYHIVAVKSTVIPGTAEGVVRPILERESLKRAGECFGLAVNPEFLREGSALHDALNPHVVVIGSSDGRSGDGLEAFYRALHRGKTPPIVRTDPSTAELIKYANNAFLATKVSFINAIANICQRVPGADVEAVAEAMGLDPRIGALYLRAGPGYGGGCLKKDLDALIAFSKGLGHDPALLRAVQGANEAQPQAVLELARGLIGSFEGRRVAVLGLAFKEGSDDVREAASIKIVNTLLEQGANVVVHDPVAMEGARRVLGGRVTYAGSVRECIKEADCCIVLTEWGDYRQLRPEDFVRHMRGAAVVDARRIYKPKDFIGRVRFAAMGLGEVPS